MYELEGDVYALNLVDLEREGLVEYRYLLKQVSGGAGNSAAIVKSSTGATIVESPMSHHSVGASRANTNNNNNGSDFHGVNEISTTSLAHNSQSSGVSTSAELINELFKTLNLDVILN